MKIRNIETGDILTLTHIAAFCGAIRLEFSSDEDCYIAYIYKDTTLEEDIEDGGYEWYEEEK